MKPDGAQRQDIARKHSCIPWLLQLLQGTDTFTQHVSVGCLQFLASSEDLRELIISRGYGDKARFLPPPRVPSTAPSTTPPAPYATCNALRPGPHPCLPPCAKPAPSMPQACTRVEERKAVDLRRG